MARFSLLLRLILPVVAVCFIPAPRIGQYTLGTSLGIQRFTFNRLHLAAAATTKSLLTGDETTTNAPILDANIPGNDDWQILCAAAANATALRGADTSNQGHDSFRYEWGTWVVPERLEHLMALVNRLRLQQRSVAYERLFQSNTTTTTTTKKMEAISRRYRVAGGRDWDVLLHVLPESTEWSGRWITGSWSILKSLTGLAEIGAVTGNNNNKPRGTVRQLQGASDGSFGSGVANTAGDDCIKYVGGPLRRYKSVFGPTTLLEIIIRPPIGSRKYVVDSSLNNNQEHNVESLPTDLMDSFFMVQPESENPRANDDTDAEDDDMVKDAATTLAALGSKTGVTFEAVGGLDVQLNAIARRVLASRANPAAARRLGVSHVRGILLSGPPGCGKTLLARELARILGARPPQIVNGPEILDKYIGEAEKKVRELFAPAEREYQLSGDDSALHIIILDEMDAIARKRGSMTSDTTGVRDSVVNQLLAKMDGVKQASNVLVVGLTNRPELLDPALLRPGRLEVQLKIELPDLLGRRDILRIHTRQMKEAEGVSPDALRWIEDTGDDGLAARTEHFSGAELAGLVRSAASFALARTLEVDEGKDEGVVSVADVKQALREVQPALGKQDEVLKLRYPLGISPYSSPMKRIMRDLERFTAPLPCKSPQLQSLLVVGGGGNGGAGATALAAWAAAKASASGSTDYVRFITALDLLSGSGDAGEEARAASLLERFAEAREMSHSLLVLDDVDQLCAGSGPAGYSSVMLATLRALLRTPPSSSSSTAAQAGAQSESKRSHVDTGRTLNVLAATSRSDAACVVLHKLFDETIVIPLLQDVESVQSLLRDCLSESTTNTDVMAELIVRRLGKVGCKTALRLAQRAVVSAVVDAERNQEAAQLAALNEILEDLAGDTITAEKMCEVI